MPDYLHCPDCGEAVFRLATTSSEHLVVDSERCSLGDIAIVGKLALVLTGKRLDTARERGTPLHRRHILTCAAFDQRLIRYTRRRLFRPSKHRKGKKAPKYAR